MQINLLWLLVGLIPYAITIQWQQGKDEHSAHIRALFWRLRIRSQKGQRSWELLLVLSELKPYLGKAVTLLLCFFNKDKVK